MSSTVIESTESAATAIGWLITSGLPEGTATAMVLNARHEPGQDIVTVPFAHRVQWEDGRTERVAVWRYAAYTVTRPMLTAADRALLDLAGGAA